MLAAKAELLAIQSTYVIIINRYVNITVGSRRLIVKIVKYSNHCNNSNLNGKYFASGPSQPDSSINWGAWHGYGYSLKRVVMMLRPH